MPFPKVVREPDFYLRVMWKGQISMFFVDYAWLLSCGIKVVPRNIVSSFSLNRRKTEKGRFFYAGGNLLKGAEKNEKKSIENL